MGLAKQRIGPFTEAMNHFEQALQIRLSSLPVNHLQFAEIYTLRKMTMLMLY
jgi:hypothetical protein